MPGKYALVGFNSTFSCGMTSCFALVTDAFFCGTSFVCVLVGSLCCCAPHAGLAQSLVPCPAGRDKLSVNVSRQSCAFYRAFGAFPSNSFRKQLATTGRPFESFETISLILFRRMWEGSTR